MSIRSKGYNSIDEYIDDYIESNMVALARKGISMFETESTPDNILAIATSSGSSVTIIRIDVPYVIQLYRLKETYDRIVDFCTAVAETDGDGREFLVPCQFHDDQNKAIGFKKIWPLNNFGVDLDTADVNLDHLKANITSALTYLSDAGMSHGDPRLDNVGVDAEGRYVLFDYDKVSFESDPSDLSKFATSFKNLLQ